MTKEDLLNSFKKAIGKKDVLALIHKGSGYPDFVKHLINVSFYPEKEIAFRSAWVLEYNIMLHPNAIGDNMQYFLDAYIRQNNLSCKRHFTKILMFFSLSKNVKALNPFDLNQVIETTFEWLIDPETPVAVQANCLDILFNLRSHCDWVEEELRAQIVFLLKGGSAAMQSRGKKVLQQLNKGC